MTADMGQLLTY